MTLYSYIFLEFLLILPGIVNEINECLDDQLNRRFFKIRTCSRSSAQILSLVNYRSLERCLSYASARNALAVNFSPQEAASFRDNNFQATCQLLACPEINESNLLNDSAYDYYSFYKNLTDDSTCIKSVGVFKLFNEKANYTDAIKKCQISGGDLAQVASEIRTNALSTFISNTIMSWAKVAYIGMDDILTSRGKFATSFGNLLTCYNYRAWAPGQPRLTRRIKNCVVLDSDRTWKISNCKAKFSFLCEIYPDAPLFPKKIINCTSITDVGEKEECEKSTKSINREQLCDIRQ